MLFKRLQEKWSKVASGYMLCRFVVFSLVIFLSYLLLLYTKNVNKEKIILMPPSIYGKVVISNDDASENYIKEMVDYLVYLATNYTPQTVAARLEEFLKYIEPANYEKVKNQVKKVAEDVVFYEKTQAFYPEKFVINKKKREVKVKGHIYKFYMGKLVEDKDQTYVVRYRIKDGEFRITAFYPEEEKKGKEQSGGKK